jgi:excisionase family DNA binding protein
MREFYKLSEVCEILGTSRRTVLRWIYEGKLKAIKLGGGRVWRVRESELRRFMRQEA